MSTPTITFSGNLAAKPELKPVDTPDGPVVVATLRVAVTPRRRGRGSEEWVDGETMWFSVSAWRSAAQNCVASLNQGDRVLVRGRLTQRTWTDADGVERPSFDVAAEEVALDLSRHAAISLRRAPQQRRPDDGAATASGDEAGWSAQECAPVGEEQPLDA
jgi:single-strand DNA-binding protein